MDAHLAFSLESESFERALHCAAAVYIGNARVQFTLLTWRPDKLWLRWCNEDLAAAWQFISFGWGIDTGIRPIWSINKWALFTASSWLSCRRLRIPAQGKVPEEPGCIELWAFWCAAALRVASLTSWNFSINCAAKVCGQQRYIERREWQCLVLVCANGSRPEQTYFIKVRLCSAVACGSTSLVRGVEWVRVEGASKWVDCKYARIYLRINNVPVAKPKP